MSAELDTLGKEGLSLTERLQVWREEITSARRAGDDRVSAGAWLRTKDVLRKLQHDPFGELPRSLIAAVQPEAAPDPAPMKAATETEKAEATSVVVTIAKQDAGVESA
jgi:hypothetical protein